MANFDTKDRIKIEIYSEPTEENDFKRMFSSKGIAIKTEPDNEYNENGNNSPEYSEVNSNILENLLVKPEVESEVEENYELSQSDIEKEFEAFNNEDEKNNSGKTILKNKTTAYKCQLCGEIYQQLLEYKNHKRNHFIEKRRLVYQIND